MTDVQKLDADQWPLKSAGDWFVTNAAVNFLTCHASLV
jgi:hypothetical protein